MRLRAKRYLHAETKSIPSSVELKQGLVVGHSFTINRYIIDQLFIEQVSRKV